MKRRLFVFVALCAVTAALVAKERRAAVNTEEEIPSATESTTQTTTSKLICAPQTPCAWSIYKPVIKYIQNNITNTYCTCGEGLECQIHEDDTSINAYIHRCRPPPQEETEYSDR